MERIIVTNNDKVAQKYKDSFTILMVDGNYTDVLCEVRNKIHREYKLLTHPMAGSLKPNQTPCKSVMLEKLKSGTDAESVVLIENSIDAALKFFKFKETPKWSLRILNDFKTVDLSLIENVVRNPMLKMV